MEEKLTEKQIEFEKLKKFIQDVIDSKEFEWIEPIFNKIWNEMIKNAEEDIKNCLTESFKAKDFTFPEMKIKGVIDLKAMF